MGAAGSKLLVFTVFGVLRFSGRAQWLFTGLSATDRFVRGKTPWLNTANSLVLSARWLTIDSGFLEWCSTRNGLFAVAEGGVLGHGGTLCLRFLYTSPDIYSFA